MFKMYVESDGKRLRCGYTTGSCSAGAAKAATLMLFNIQNDMKTISVMSPKNIKIDMDIHKIERGHDYVKCSIIKFSGDDPDITNGIEICATVKEINDYTSDMIENDDYVILKGGEGVGIVTQDGLFVDKGQSAINPVPRRMIKNEVQSVLPLGKAVEVTISVPEGKEVAKKTFNPRLGIVDGISILGTTGIVYPMSEDALKSSVKLEIHQKAISNDNLILTFGNLGENFCLKNGFDKNQIVICSNYIGFALDTCRACGIKKVIVAGHIGKMSKIAYGCFNTHSRVNGVRLEVFALELTLLGYDIELVKRVLKEKTTEGAVKMLGEGYDKLYENIGVKIKDKIKEYVYNEMDVDIAIYYGAREPILLWKSF